MLKLYTQSQFRINIVFIFMYFDTNIDLIPFYGGYRMSKQLFNEFKICLSSWKLKSCFSERNLDTDLKHNILIQLVLRLLKSSASSNEHFKSAQHEIIFFYVVVMSFCGSAHESWIQMLNGVRNEMFRSEYNNNITASPPPGSPIYHVSWRLFVKINKRMTTLPKPEITQLH